MFSFKKNLIFILLICLMIFSISFSSAQEIDEDIISIDESPTDFISENDIGSSADELSESNLLSSADFISENDIGSSADENDAEFLDSYSNIKTKSILKSTGSESDNYIDDEGLYEEYIEDEPIKAKLVASKLTTTYKSGKYLTIKAIDANTKKPIPYAYLKLRVFTGKKYKDYYIDTGGMGIAKFKTSSLSRGTHKVIVSNDDFELVSSSIKTYITINKAKTIVKAPKLTAKYKKSTYFKIKVKYKSSKKIVKGLKLKLKVFTGNKYKVYKVKTNSKGIAKFKTSKLKPGTHKVKISSSNKNFYVNYKSSIFIKKAKKKTTGKSKSSNMQSGSYVGSGNSDVFHYSSCASAKRIKSYNRITFTSRADALNSGYRPCKTCHP